MWYYAFKIVERLSPQNIDFQSVVLFKLERDIPPSILLDAHFVKWQKRPDQAPWRVVQPSHSRMKMQRETLRQIKLVRVDYAQLTASEYESLSTFHPQIECDDELLAQLSELARQKAAVDEYDPRMSLDQLAVSPAM